MSLLRIVFVFEFHWYNSSIPICTAVHLQWYFFVNDTTASINFFSLSICFFIHCIDIFVQTTYTILYEEVFIMAKSNTSNISIRMDSDLKAAAESLYAELGMNISTAFNIFVRQSLRERGIPFKITEGTPNKDTVSTLLEAERITNDPSVRGYHNIDELFDDLDA